MYKDNVKELEKYYKSKGIGKDSFSCSNVDKCKINGEDNHQGADTYIGSKYGEPFNLVVVCLDPGKDSKTFEERRLQIEGSNPDNPHMKGTQKTLAALLVNEDIDKVDLFSHYAMVNSCKCFPSDGTMNKAPDDFFVNCRNHINDEIRLLEPDIIITQGNQAINAVAKYINQKSAKEFYHAIATDMEREYPTYFPKSYFKYLMDKYFRYVEIDNRIVPTICPPHPSDRYGKWHFFQEAYLVVSMELARRALVKVKM